MLKRIFNNLKTTLAGSIAGGTVLLEGIQTKNVVLIITGISTILLGLLASDELKADQTKAQ